MTYRESEKGKRRKLISVFNETERMNKHPSVYLNYLRVLVEGKGMRWQVDEGQEEAPAPPPDRKSYKISNILEAPDLDQDAYEEIGGRKKIGKTTTEENFQWEKAFWKRYLLVGSWTKRS
jgi:hypothetical protein